MPLGKFHQKRGKPLSSDSYRDELYGQLLDSLNQGGEPLATKEEYAQFVREWTEANPKGNFPLLGGSLPRAIQRHQALNFINLFNYKFWYDIKNDTRKEGEEPPDPAKIMAWYRQWRKRLIENYKLDGLVPQEEEIDNEDEPVS